MEMCALTARSETTGLLTSSEIRTGMIKTSTSEIFQGYEKPQGRKWRLNCALTFLACRNQPVNHDSIGNSAAGHYFKVNSQAVCFLQLPSKMTNRWSAFLLEPLRWAHWSSARAPLRENEVVCVCAPAKQPHLNHFNKALWCPCLLPAALFAVRVCLGCCSRLATWTGLRFSLGISLFCSHDDTSIIAVLDKWPVSKRNTNTVAS